MPFKLHSDPSITTRHDRDVHTVGMIDVLLHAHDFHALTGYVPPMESAMLRLLITLASRVSGLDTAVSPTLSWDERRNELLAAGKFDAARVADYFQQYSDRFDLFDSARPFMQDPRLALEPGSSGIGRLVPNWPTGNTQPWMCHIRPADKVTLPAAEAFGWLLVQHQYGPSGGGLPRERPPEYLDVMVQRAEETLRNAAPKERAEATKKLARAKKAKDNDSLAWQYLKTAPLRGTDSIFLTGRTLFETLVLNLPHPELTAARTDHDVAPWEADELPELINPPEATWPAGLLVGRSRHAILLTPNAGHTEVTDCHLTWSHLEPPRPVLDPYLVHWATNDEQAEPNPILSVGTRPVWRDLDAIVGVRTRDKGSTTPPSIVAQSEGLPGPVRDRAGLRILSFEQDRKTRDLRWYSTATPPVLCWTPQQDPGATERARMLAAAAEEVFGRLRWALLQAWEGLFREAPKRGGRQTCAWIEDAATVFWPEAEALFWRYMRSGMIPEPVVTAPFADAALRALDEATRAWTGKARVVEAIAGAERQVETLRRPTPAGTTPKKRGSS